MIPSSRDGDRAFVAACVLGLEAAGFGSPRWLDRDRTGEVAPIEPLDFVLDFSGAAASGDARAARFGVWSFDVDGGHPPAWRASVAGRRSVHARLRATLDDGSRVTLQEGMLPVSAGYRRTRTFIDAMLAIWPARAAADIATGGWSDLPRSAAADQRRVDGLNQGDRSIQERIGWMIASPWVRLARWWRDTARYDTWNVGLTSLPDRLTDLGQLRAIGGLHWLPPRPPLYFLADPFPCRVNGRETLLVEDYGHPKGVRGRISRVELDEATVTITPAIVRDSHLSYPFTFEDGGGVYCAAEMSQEDGCILYQAADDGRWQPRHHILRGQKIVDPTFTLVDGRWWLFCTDARGAGSVALNAFFADQIGGPWTAHALNPLKCDLASARPAGRPFTIGARLFRPAQDCSATYGGAVNIMEIVELSPTRFREVCATRLEPDRDGPYPDGLHHLVVDGRRVYIDAKRTRYDYLLWLKAWLGRRRS